MRFTFALAAAVIPSFAGTTTARAQQAPTLVVAEAVFETTTNDKDHDSIVSIVVKVGNSVIASSNATDGHWNDHTTHVVNLDVGQGWTKDDVRRGKTELSFSTNGNDKWEFNYVLRLYWSDDPDHTRPVECRWNGQVLTQDDRFRSFAVCGF